MKTLKNTVAALILVAFTGTSLFAQQTGKKEEKAPEKKQDKKKDDKNKNMAVKGEGVSNTKTKTAPPAKTGTTTTNK